MTQDFIFAQDVIVDPDTAKILAVVRNGGVWRNGARIAVLVGAHMYDLNGKSARQTRRGRWVFAYFVQEPGRGQIGPRRARISHIAMPRATMERRKGTMERRKGKSHSLGVVGPQRPS
jgi:hypothetical protein